MTRQGSYYQNCHMLTYWAGSHFVQANDLVRPPTWLGQQEGTAEGADLELAAFDQLEGEDCRSLFSKGMTHGRHAARCDATNILQGQHSCLLQLSVCVSDCLSFLAVCLSVWFSVRPSVRLSVCVCLSVTQSSRSTWPGRQTQRHTAKHGKYSTRHPARNILYHHCLLWVL